MSPTGTLAQSRRPMPAARMLLSRAIALYGPILSSVFLVRMICIAILNIVTHGAYGIPPLPVFIDNEDSFIFPFNQSTARHGAQTSRRQQVTDAWKRMEKVQQKRPLDSKRQQYSEKPKAPRNTLESFVKRVKPDKPDQNDRYEQPPIILTVSRVVVSLYHCVWREKSFLCHTAVTTGLRLARHKGRLRY